MRKFFLTFLFLLSVCSSFSQERADSAVVSYLRREYDVAFSENNSIVFFKNGQEKFDDMFAAIRQARHSVHLEYFNFRNDSISALLFDLLKQKAAEGVEVRAVFDGFGNSSNNRPLKRRHLDSLRAHNIEIVEFDPIRFPYLNHAVHCDHRKIVVIDGLLAYTGGMNVADYYIVGKPEFGEWRDVHTRVQGDAVDVLQGIFLEFWNKVTSQNVHGPQYYTGGRDSKPYFSGLKADTTSSAGQKHIGVVDRGPRSPRHIIHDTFVETINAAQHQLCLINPYFTLCPHIRRAIRKAIKRGVDVQIMVSSKSDIPITPRIVEHTVHRLMKAGATVYFFDGGFHHSKILMADGSLSFLGSANLNSRSLSFDYECNLLVADSASTKELLHIFNTDKQTRCWQLTPDTWKTQFSRKRRRAAWFWQFLTPFV